MNESVSFSCSQPCCDSHRDLNEANSASSAGFRSSGCTPSMEKAGLVAGDGEVDIRSRGGVGEVGEKREEEVFFPSFVRFCFFPLQTPISIRDEDGNPARSSKPRQRCGAEVVSNKSRRNQKAVDPSLRGSLLVWEGWLFFLTSLWNYIFRPTLQSLPVCSCLSFFKKKHEELIAK